MRKFQLAALILTLLLAGTSSAAPISADFGLLPSDNQSNGAIQTFTTDSLGGEVRFLLVGGPTGGSDGTAGVTAMIFDVAAGGANGDASVTLGTLLDTSDTQDLPATASHPDVTTFDFGGDVTLAANTLYAVAFSTDGGTTVGNVRVGFRGGTTYAGGESFNADGTVAFANAFDISIGFIPEPTSFAMLIAGSLMVLRRRRHE